MEYFDYILNQYEILIYSTVQFHRLELTTICGQVSKQVA